MALLTCACACKPVAAAEFTVTPSASVGTKYSDNIDFTAKNKKGDFYNIYSPSVQLQKRDERGEFNIKGAVNSFTYMERTEYDSIDHEIWANATHSLNSVLSLNAFCQQKIDNQSDRAIASSGLISTHSEREQNQKSLGLDWLVSEKTTLGSRAIFGDMQYGDHKYTDNTSKTYTFDIKSNLSKYSPETIGLLSFSHSKYDYDLSQNNYYTTITLGFRKDLNEKFSFTTIAGPSLFETKYKSIQLQESQDWGTAVNCSLDVKLEKSDINISFANEIAPDSFNNTSVNRMTLKGTYLTAFSSKTRGGVAASYYRNETAENDKLSNSSDNNNTINITPKFIYQITDDISLEAVYNLSRVDEKSDNSENREQNSVFLQLSWSRAFNKSDIFQLINQ